MSAARRLARPGGAAFTTRRCISGRLKRWRSFSSAPPWVVMDRAPSTRVHDKVDRAFFFSFSGELTPCGFRRFNAATGQRADIFGSASELVSLSVGSARWQTSSVCWNPLRSVCAGLFQTPVVVKRAGTTQTGAVKRAAWLQGTESIRHQVFVPLAPS